MSQQLSKAILKQITTAEALINRAEGLVVRHTDTANSLKAALIEVAELRDRIYKGRRTFSPPEQARLKALFSIIQQGDWQQR